MTINNNSNNNRNNDKKKRNEFTKYKINIINITINNNSNNNNNNDTNKGHIIMNKTYINISKYKCINSKRNAKHVRNISSKNLRRIVETPFFLHNHGQTNVYLCARERTLPRLDLPTKSRMLRQHSRALRVRELQNHSLVPRPAFASCKRLASSRNRITGHQSRIPKYSGATLKSGIEKEHIFLILNVTKYIIFSFNIKCR